VRTLPRLKLPLPMLIRCCNIKPPRGQEHLPDRLQLIVICASQLGRSFEV
jgi:hypothetical protein